MHFEGYAYGSINVPVHAMPTAAQWHSLKISYFISVDTLDTQRTQYMKSKRIYSLWALGCMNSDDDKRRIGSDVLNWKWLMVERRTFRIFQLNWQRHKWIDAIQRRIRIHYYFHALLSWYSFGVCAVPCVFSHEIHIILIECSCRNEEPGNGERWLSDFVWIFNCKFYWFEFMDANYYLWYANMKF